MRVRALIHIDMNAWVHQALLEARGLHPEETRLWAGEALPEPGSFDFLIVMGAP
jgi:hypothetical protein